MLVPTTLFISARRLSGGLRPSERCGLSRLYQSSQPARAAVRSSSIGPGAQVADAERLASERVHDRAVARPVIGEHPLDPDPVTAEEGDCAAQEADRSSCLLVAEHLDIGEPGRVVDGDVHELPADPAAPGRAVAVDAVAGPADLSQLLDIDVDELAWPRPLVAVGRLVRP